MSYVEFKAITVLKCLARSNDCLEGYLSFRAVEGPWPDGHAAYQSPSQARVAKLNGVSLRLFNLDMPCEHSSSSAKEMYLSLTLILFLLI